MTTSGSGDSHTDAHRQSDAHGHGDAHSHADAHAQPTPTDTPTAAPVVLRHYLPLLLR